MRRLYFQEAGWWLQNGAAMQEARKSHRDQHVIFLLKRQRASCSMMFTITTKTAFHTVRTCNKAGNFTNCRKDEQNGGNILRLWKTAKAVFLQTKDYIQIWKHTLQSRHSIASLNIWRNELTARRLHPVESPALPTSSGFNIPRPNQAARTKAAPTPQPGDICSLVLSGLPHPPPPSTGSHILRQQLNTSLAESNFRTHHPN